MENKGLIRKLNSVGKAVFVEYFETFYSHFNNKISKEDCIELLMQNKVSNENGAAIRCSNAKLIFKFKKEFKALEIILNSSRLSIDIRQRAKEIMKDYQ